MANKRMVKVVSVTNDGLMTVHSKRVRIPNENVKQRHYLNLSPEKQKEFWPLSKAIEEKVKKFKALQKENERLRILYNRKVANTINGWFNDASLKSVN